MATSKDSEFWDEAQGAAQRMTQAYRPDRPGISEHATPRFARKMNFRGFTLLEVLVALVIVGTALGASLRAIGSLTQNSGDLRASMMATWSAENRLTQIRITQEWPAIGNRQFPCPQAELALLCDEQVVATPNPFFRRVEIAVFDQEHERRIVKLTQVVPSAQ